MAANDAESDPEGGLELRDLNEQDDKPYLTRPTSQLDLERRLDEDHKPDSDLSLSLKVNPNPFGDEDYAGTDPIYQNHANDTETPYAAEEGPDKDAEDAVRELYEFSDDDEVVPDFGLGGESTRSTTAGPAAERYLTPGQEGYPDNPEKYVGPAVPASLVEADNGDDSDEDSEDIGQKVADAQPDSQPPNSPTAQVTQPSPTPFGGDKS